MTILLVLTSLILISIAVWQLTKILELSKPADYDDSEIASDKDNDMQGKLMFLFLIFIYAFFIREKPSLPSTASFTSKFLSSSDRTRNKTLRICSSSSIIKIFFIK